MCSHRLAAVLDELHSAVRLVLVNFLGCMVEQRRGGRHRRSGGGVANRRRHMAAAPRPDPVGPEPAIDEIAGGAGGGHADGWCRSCGLRSADLVALGFVRLLVVRQSQAGGGREALRFSGAVPADDQA
jgi:hypothetical protein